MGGEAGIFSSNAKKNTYPKNSAPGTLQTRGGGRVSYKL